ncbi:Uncharacterized protein Rs2_45409 [Raphanus sativus]|nr:Uncharacterized protein Rs2_50666 [Raphanus sativus]KAJ4872925.1 Uncharacterized protein Rs2_45409 [Raphanus sativus]
MNLSLGGSGRPVLPVSDPPLSGENDTSDGKGVDDHLFKGSAMTKHGAYAALSCMTELINETTSDEVLEVEQSTTFLSHPALGALNWNWTHEAASSTYPVVSTLVEGGATCVGKTRNKRVTIVVQAF